MKAPAPNSELEFPEQKSMQVWRMNPLLNHIRRRSVEFPYRDAASSTGDEETSLAIRGQNDHRNAPPRDIQNDHVFRIEDVMFKAEPHGTPVD
jgi:hypothetical protein